MRVSSVPVSGRQLGCVVARCLVAGAGTPLEVVAGQVALGRVCLQIQVVWVWPVKTGSHAGRELGCMALMLVTAGVTKGGTRYLVFTVLMFKCMERIDGTIHCCCW